MVYLCHWVLEVLYGCKVIVVIWVLAAFDRYGTDLLNESLRDVTVSQNS